MPVTPAGWAILRKPLGERLAKRGLLILSNRGRLRLSHTVCGVLRSAAFARRAPDGAGGRTICPPFASARKSIARPQRAGHPRSGAAWLLLWAGHPAGPGLNPREARFGLRRRQPLLDVHQVRLAAGRLNFENRALRVLHRVLPSRHIHALRAATMQANSAREHVFE